MKHNQAIKLIVLLTLATAGCLQTRTDVEEAENKKVMHDQVQHLQKSTADQNSRFQDINEDLRQLNGRVDVFENKLNVAASDRDKKMQAMEVQIGESNKKIVALTEEMIKLENQIQGMAAAFEASKAAQAKAAAKQNSQSSFDAAEEAFTGKDWANAILKFSEYRDANPKGKKYPEATYKIGVSFESLGKKKEAKAFYEELIDNFPKSSFSAKAKDKLKKLK